MPIPRRLQINLDQTSDYHCTSRCVRRAFLCGRDQLTGQNFEHRRKWIEDRIRQLSSIFAIEILAYAIMHNHYHVVLRVNTEKASKWSDDDVAKRWSQLFAVPEEGPERHELRTWKQRLTSISWFMRCINEPLARRANREDDCTGRFWEGRFKAQALLDDTALLRCMTYVDLNPVRSGLARHPDTARHTSFHARLAGKESHLAGFSDNVPAGGRCIAIRRDEYMKLVRWSARCLTSAAQGRLPADCTRVLERLEFSRDQWMREIRHYGRWYYRAVGCQAAIERYCSHLGQRWLKGAGRARILPA